MVSPRLALGSLCRHFCCSGSLPELRCHAPVVNLVAMPVLEPVQDLSQQMQRQLDLTFFPQACAQQRLVAWTQALRQPEALWSPCRLAQAAAVLATQCACTPRQC
jgi:hypothetical protein